ncbi:glycosyltransferase family 2 protein [Hoylesella oralis]|uniref:glycosyltransferase family 2 protein n=1 Tax=Hoylesella oralis TaxID=28134 RepID=UPI0028F03887|nr:glycosyltransferase family 2 protein [Hoylesella oralis]
MTNENNEHVPAISVVMPVYNAEQYIKESIESIINQSFTDFECIIVDDGSDDHTPDIINTIVDERIILIASSHDFVKSLNKGVSAARGKYIARMDADDIMHPDRLRIQYEIMETEPSITVCSTWMRLFGKDVSPGRISQSICGLVEYPLLAFLQGNFVFHPTTMIRKSFLDENTLLYEHYPYAEDLKLWKEIALRGGRVLCGKSNTIKL